MFEETLARIGAALVKRNIPYMIIGWQAVLLYGEPLLTRDIDITLGINTNHLNQLLIILRRCHNTQDIRRSAEGFRGCKDNPIKKP